MKKKGFTLVELLLAVLILAFTLSGILALFVSCIFLNATNKNIALAYAAAQQRMEEITNPNAFGALDALNNTTFELNGFPAGTSQARISVAAVAGSTNRLRRVGIIACFMVHQRPIGDSITNCQSSPIELETLVAE